MKKIKSYEVNGVINYAHCYCIEVEAHSQKEARKLAESLIDREIDPAVAEYQDYIMDKPIEIKDWYMSQIDKQMSGTSGSPLKGKIDKQGLSEEAITTIIQELTRDAIKFGSAMAVGDMSKPAPSEPKAIREIMAELSQAIVKAREEERKEIGKNFALWIEAGGFSVTYKNDKKVDYDIIKTGEEALSKKELWKT